MTTDGPHTQFHLLRTKRFLPFFGTQFFGAFNDNLFKNALIIGITYRSMSVAGLAPQAVVALAAGLFILPFFLFSAVAGQLSDKYSKSIVIRWVKVLEIGIMSLAAVGFWCDSVPLLLGVLFLMGAQSSFFGPAKYSILPDLLSERELTGGNALVETGTFVAILLGTIAGGVIGGTGGGVISAAVILVAIAGYGVSLLIPRTEAANSALPFTFNPIRPMTETLSIVCQNRSVLLSITAISWFWFVGASFLTLLPGFGKDVLGVDQAVVTLFLALFCIGVAVGSLLCERLGGKKIELGLVPLGSIGISVVAADMMFASPAEPYGLLISLDSFLNQTGAWRLMIDFFVLAVSGGFYTVPLYTLIQERSDLASRSRVIAGNNILNAMFMVMSAAMLLVLPKAGVTIPQIFMVLAVVNIVIAASIYSMVPEFTLRFIAWVLARVVYRVRLTGAENLPGTGAALLVADHVSPIDWLIISNVYQRPIRFVMDSQFSMLPLVNYLIRDEPVIPVNVAHENEGALNDTTNRVSAELLEGHVVCLFLNGTTSAGRQLHLSTSDLDAILAKAPVPVVSIALKTTGRLWSRIEVDCGVDDNTD